MKRLLLALTLFALPSATWAQCNGVFPAQTFCGNATGSPALPQFVPQSATAAPAGTNGQIQYNNASSLGGFTATQDCTITPSTGIVLCLKTNNVAFGTAATQNTGTSGATLPFLNGTNTWSGINTWSSPSVFPNVRKKLTTTTSFFLDRTSGSDVTGCGLASGASACQTPAFLISILLTLYDFGGQVVSINLADSASTYAPIIVNGPWVGGTAVAQTSSNIAFIGNTTTPANVKIDGGGTGSCVEADEGSSFRISGVQVQNCALGLTAPEQHAELYFDHISWASMPAGSIGIYASRMGYIEMTGGSNTVSSIGAYFLQATHQGNFRASGLNTGATAITLVGSLTCTNGQFAYASSQGDITFTQYSATAFAGPAATCVQWSADSNGLFQVLNSSTGKALTPNNFFPGNVAGSCLGDCSIDQAGHGSTSINTCGTSPVLSGGSNDYYGHVLEGTTATGCIILFGSPVGSVPYFCQITWTTAVPATLTRAQNGNQLVLSHASTSSAAFDYLCKGF